MPSGQEDVANTDDHFTTNCQNVADPGMELDEIGNGEVDGVNRNASSSRNAEVYDFTTPVKKSAKRSKMKGKKVSAVRKRSLKSSTRK